MYYFVDWPKKYIRLSFLFYVCNSAGATPMRRKRSSLALGKVWTWNGDYGGVLIPLLKSNVPANLDRTPLHFAAMQVELRRCNYMFRRWTQIKTEKEEHMVSSAAWVLKEVLCSAYREVVHAAWDIVSITSSVCVLDIWCSSTLQSSTQFSLRAKSWPRFGQCTVDTMLRCRIWCKWVKWDSFYQAFTTRPGCALAGD